MSCHIVMVFGVYYRCCNPWNGEAGTVLRSYDVLSSVKNRETHGKWE